jgi:hypothetical protein
MNSLLDRLFRLRLAASLLSDNSTIREKRIAELRSLLDEIAAPSGDDPSCGEETDDEQWLHTSAA